jgi:hypothetical protein
MIDEDPIPVVVWQYEQRDEVEELLAVVADPYRRNRRAFRALRPFTVSLPRRLVTDPSVTSMCPVVVGDLRRWDGQYDQELGVSPEVGGMETIL